MRSKEVEEAIEKTKRIRTGLMNFNELLDNNNVVINGIDKVLNYIEELEKLPNKIKNKLIELAKKLTEPNDDRWEKDDNAYYEKIQAQIRVLKEIIGE